MAWNTLFYKIVKWFTSLENFQHFSELETKRKDFLLHRKIVGFTRDNLTHRELLYTIEYLPINLHKLLLKNMKFVCVSLNWVSGTQRHLIVSFTLCILWRNFSFSKFKKPKFKKRIVTKYDASCVCSFVDHFYALFVIFVRT